MHGGEVDRMDQRKVYDLRELSVLPAAQLEMTTEAEGGGGQK